jgi:predicted Zn-ribbon and HTH transcriptional regulator
MVESSDLIPERLRELALPPRCPECNGDHVHRSKPKGVLESYLLPILFIRPYRCDACDFRFFRFSSVVPWSRSQEYRARSEKIRSRPPHLNV